MCLLNYKFSMLLLHPTHRKFIKLLHKHVSNGNVILLTMDDFLELEEGFKRTKNSLKRHQIVYKIFLRAINRPIVVPYCNVIVIDELYVKRIEKYFRRLELKNLHRVLKSIIVMNVIKLLRKTKLVDFDL